jgi:GTP-binding protein
MSDGDEMVVADIPGLIEGASEGRGLGHRFLRHIERARALCVLLDLSPLAERPPPEQLAVLLDEIEAYDPDLARRPRIVVGSKADLAGQAPGADGSADLPPDRPPGLPPEVELLVSAVTGQEVDRLVGRLADLVRSARAELAEPTQFVVHRPVREGYEVVREGGGWVVEGREAVRAVALSDLTRGDALAEAQRRLKQLGIDKALARAGAQPGDSVRIGGMTFDYQDDDGTPL